jgi:hypothetical protein
MNSTGGMVVGNALKVVNGSLHHPSVNIGMTAGFTKLVLYTYLFPACFPFKLKDQTK